MASHFPAPATLTNGNPKGAEPYFRECWRKLIVIKLPTFLVIPNHLFMNVLCIISFVLGPSTVLQESLSIPVVGIARSKIMNKVSVVTGPGDSIINKWLVGTGPGSECAPTPTMFSPSGEKPQQQKWFCFGLSPPKRTQQDIWENGPTHVNK